MTCLMGHRRRLLGVSEVVSNEFNMSSVAINYSRKKNMYFLLTGKVFAMLQMIRDLLQKAFLI